MSDAVVPAATRLAAKRAFIRTTAQAYAATLGGGVTVTGVLAIITGQVDLVTVIVTLAVALVSPVLAGAASYASILGAGIPDDYKVGVLAAHSAVPVELRESAVEVAARHVSGEGL